MTAEEDREALLAQAVDLASMLGGVVSSLSAALMWGWQVKALPSRPEVTVPRGSRYDPDLAAAGRIRRLDLRPGDIDGYVTTPARSLVDCMRRLPFDEALAVTDSALRGGFSGRRMRELAAAAKGPRSTHVRRVATYASPLAANPFESVLRALALSAGLDVRPQVRVGGDTFLGRPDLVDVGLGVIIEADSFEHHGSAEALRRDAGRYNRFVAAGWLVLRFTWEEVMFHPEQVRQVLLDVVARRRAERGPSRA